MGGWAESLPLLFLLRRDALKEQIQKDQTSSNAWPKSDSRKCPITQHEPKWDRFEGGELQKIQPNAENLKKIVKKMTDARFELDNFTKIRPTSEFDQT